MAIKQPHKMIEAWLNQFDLEPKELLKLIESSESLDPAVPVNNAVIQGIELLEGIGLPKTQLQAKYTLFLVELQSEYENTGEELSENGRSALESQGWGDGILTLTGEEEGVDTLAHMGFTEQNEEFRKKLEEGDTVDLYVRLTAEPLTGHAELKSAAKAPGHNLKLVSRGQHLMFRLINIAENHMEKEVTVVLRCDTGFFSDAENRGLVQQFLNHYKQVGRGALVSVRDFFPNDISGAREVVLRFTTNGLSTDRTEVLVDGKGAIWSKGKDLREQVELWGIDQPKAESHVLEGDEVLKIDKTAGYEDAIAYININGVSALEVLPRANRSSVPVLKSLNNIDKLIALVALECLPEVTERFGGKVPGVLDCVTGYDGFIANCLPLFLFGRTSRMKDPGFGPNKVRIYNEFSPDSKEFAQLISQYSHLIDAEGSKLISVGMSIWREEGKTVYEYMESGDPEDEDYEEFSEIYASCLKKAEEQLVKEYMVYLIG